MIAALLALTLTSARADAAPTARDAEAFLRGLYAPFVAKSAMATTDPQDSATIYHPRLLALIAKDAATADGAPTLNGDPLCNCQDWERLKGLRINARPHRPGHATATVTFRNGARRDTLFLKLETVGQVWRVADVGDAGRPSLVAFLQQAIAARVTASPQPAP